MKKSISKTNPEFHGALGRVGICGNSVVALVAEQDVPVSEWYVLLEKVEYYTRVFLKKKGFSPFSECC